MGVGVGLYMYDVHIGYKNSSGDQIANVNFFYDHIAQYFKI